MRKLRVVVDALLASMTAEFDALYARRGRPSVPPEMLLKALLLPILFSIRSKRLLVEAIDDNLLDRWFVGLNLDFKGQTRSNDTHAGGTAERQAALKMLARPKRQARRLTVGADKGYDCKALVEGCRKLGDTPHVAAKAQHSAMDGRTTRHQGYKTSLRVRKRIEEAFGWIKTVGGLAKTKLIGQARLAGQALLCFATYNLVRMGSIGGWWDAHHA
ncbi:MAG: transposase [Tepidimonas sp.]|nr:transposase [Tepidimonas sp.]